MTTTDKRGHVHIEFGDDATPHHVEVHNHVYQLGENRNVLRNVARTIAPIEEGREFDRLEFKEKGVEVGKITRADAKDIQRTCDLAAIQPEPSEPQPVTAILQVLGPVYDLDAPTWRFWYGENQITADISNTDIASRALARGGVGVGDRYKVTLQIAQHVTATGQIRNNYKITNVEEFIPGAADLFSHLSQSPE